MFDLSARWAHAVTMEAVKPEHYKYFPIPKGHTLVVVERFENGIVKVCHSGNRRGNGLIHMANVAINFARAYGATYVNCIQNTQSPSTSHEIAANRK